MMAKKDRVNITVKNKKGQDLFKRLMVETGKKCSTRKGVVTCTDKKETVRIKVR